MTRETDVVVIGSGASGLTAALSAAAAGLRVLVLEKAGVLGGTSVISGGSIWAPVNKYLAKAGGHDDREDALTYLRALGLGRVDDALLAAFVDAVNPMLDFVEHETGIEFTANLEHPDYQPELPGARCGGRTLQVGLYDTKRLGELRRLLRPTHSSLPLTKEELDEWGQDTLDRWDWALLAQRTQDEIVGMGGALIGELLEACVRHGVELRVGAPASELLTEGGRVCGVVVGPDGERIDVRAGVVLASGGFEWDEGQVNAFLGVPMVAPGSPPANEGDGLRMAMTVGAALGNMTEAWWDPMLDVVGDTYDGRPLHRTTSSIRALPGGIIVNRYGRRFANEAMNYNDFTKALAHFDPGTYSYANVPCWLVFDARFRRSYSVGTVTPDALTPAWMAEAPTWRELAATVGIDPDGLESQVARFDEGAREGTDPAFHRGVSAYDRYRGDDRVQPHRNLRPMEEGPYYAVQLHFGCIGTKGGPVTDALGRVLGTDRRPIPGLYACGNVAASAFGPGYPGGGATLGVGMAYGYLIGKALGGGVSV